MTPREKILLGIITTHTQIVGAMLGVIERNTKSINEMDQFIIRGCVNMMNISGEELGEFDERDNLISEMKESLTFVN